MFFCLIGYNEVSLPVVTQVLEAIYQSQSRVADVGAQTVVHVTTSAMHGPTGEVNEAECACWSRTGFAWQVV